MVIVAIFLTLSVGKITNKDLTLNCEKKVKYIDEISVKLYTLVIEKD